MLAHMKTTTALALLMSLSSLGCAGRAVTTAEIQGTYSVDVSFTVDGEPNTTTAPMAVRAVSPTTIAFDPTVGCELECELSSLGERNATGIISHTCTTPEGPIAWTLTGTCDWYAASGVTGEPALLFDISGTATGPGGTAVVEMFGAAELL